MKSNTSIVRQFLKFRHCNLFIKRSVAHVAGVGVIKKKLIQSCCPSNCYCLNKQNIATYVKLNQLQSDTTTISKIDMEDGFEVDLVDALKTVVKDSGWQCLGSVADLKKNKCKRFYAEDGEDLVLIYVPGQNTFYCMDAACSHEEDTSIVEIDYEVKMSLLKAISLFLAADTYLCIPLKMSELNTYIVDLEPHANKKVAHHMLLYGCDTPGIPGAKVWNCGGMEHPSFKSAGTCKTGNKGIIYAWAYDAPGLTLPKAIVRHWVNSILTYCVDDSDVMPMILFVATHSDLLPEDLQEKMKIEFVKKVTDMFGTHERKKHFVFDPVFFINGTDKNDQEIQNLKNQLVSIAQNQPSWGLPRPMIWVPLELLISNMKKDNVNIIFKSHLAEANKMNGDLALSD
ncbi:unnamed protein product [Mytilus edulis]|uniref:Copper type II ascorbate-dependent monooxygenase N-terminal domain-containing protein n=1 Tax=Mytilus edulis TaxID=6550 RepID=A0A8S3SYG8_MYTED|nr:unnamed protein product [Mytilus edulis]